MEASQVAEALAYLCANAEELLDLLDEDGVERTGPLSQLLAVLRAQQEPGGQTSSGEDVLELMTAVHLAVQARGDTLGLFDHDGSRSGVDGLGLESLEIVYRCPLKVCAGRSDDEVAEYPPRCAVSDAQLIRAHLDA